MATFIRYIIPGAFVNDEQVVHCPAGEPAGTFALNNAPPGAVAFQVGKRNETQVNPTWFDGVTWFKGEVVTPEEAIAEVKARGWDHSILEFNCKANGYTQLVKLPNGAFQPFGASDTML